METTEGVAETLGQGDGDQSHEVIVEQLSGDKSRELIAEQLIESVPKGLEEALPGLMSVKSGYQWFSTDNFDNAKACFKALIQAFSNGYNEAVSFFAGAITDLNNRDRAERASSLFDPKVEPIREIPTQIIISTGMIFKRVDKYDLQLKELTTWDIEIPFVWLPTIAMVGYDACPDIFCLAYYASKQGKEMPSTLLWARYGGWYIKVAEWE